MKMTRDNFAQLLIPGHKKIIWNTYREKPEQFSQIFAVDTMNKKTETMPHYGGFGKWASNTEGNTINEDKMSEGELATFEAVRYDKGYSLTWELVQDDQYNKFKNVKNGLGVGGSAQGIGRGLRVTIEENCGNIINDGFTNIGYDGVSLFNNAHPLIDSAATCDNLITGVVSDTNVKAALTLLRGHVDEAGLKIEAKGDTIFGAANIEWDIYTILKSTQKSGELINDKNVIPALKAVIMDYLTDSYWGVKDSTFTNLMFLWREKPWFDSQPIPKTVDHFVYGYARFDEGYSDYRGIVASQGQ